MLPLGFSQPKPPIRVIPIGGAVFTLNLGADDPDFIVLEASSSSFSGAKINLPASAALGKVFKFAITTNPLFSFSLTTHFIDIVFPIPRGTGVNNYWRLFSGQRPSFTLSVNGWVSDGGSGSSNLAVNNQQDLAIGSGANGSYGGVAVGFGAVGITNGVAVGGSSVGSGGVAVGNGAAGTNGVAIGTNSNGVSGVAVGSGANGSSIGVAIGTNSNGSNYGTAVGDGASSSNGVALGTNAISINFGTSLGYAARTNSQNSAVALGFYSKAQRYRELVKAGDNAFSPLQLWAMVNWYGDTTSATATELLLGGTAAQRCILLDNSAFMFSMQIICGVTGGGNTSSWTISGAIKRGVGVATTVLVGVPIITMTGQDAGASTWNVAVTADTTNGSLNLTVTGAAATTIRWNATATLSEMRF